MNKKIINYIPLIIVAVMILTYLYALRYIVPSADDLANALDVRGRMADANRFTAVFNCVKDGYLYNQGTWFASVLDFLPLSYAAFDSLWAVRFFLLFADVLFFLSIAFFVRALSKRFSIVSAYGYVFFAIFWLAMNYEAPAETLYWMNGACVYTIPFALAFISMGSFLSFLDSQHTFWIIIAMICAFFSTGGNLIIAGFMNAFVVCMLLAQLREHKKLQVREIIYFAVCFAGALFNALAPGNFLRHENYAEGGKLFISDAIINTALVINDRFIRMMTKDTLIGCAIAIVVIVILCLDFDVKKEKMKMTPIGMWIGAYLCLYAAFFPAVLAFHTTMDDPYLGVRVDHITGWMMSIVLMIAVTYTAVWIKVRMVKKSKSKKEKEAAGFTVGITIAISAIVINTVLLMYNDEKPYIARFYQELSDGTLKSFYENRFDALIQIQNSDLDVVFITDWLTVSHIMKDLELSSDSSWWVNQVTARYYNKAEVYYSPPLYYYELYGED